MDSHNPTPTQLNSAKVYSCHAFNDAFTQGKASGKFYLDASRLHYQFEKRNGAFPFSELSLTLGGAGNRLIFIAHPSAPELTIYTSDLSLLQDPQLASHPECAAQLQKAAGFRKRNAGLLVSIILLILAIPIGFLWNLEKLSGLAATQIPTSWEAKLGEKVSEQYTIAHKLMDQKTADKALAPLVSHLTQALKNSPYQYHFTIVNDGSLNAFALPGGFITIHSGLILKADTAEELLGVIAHEINHVEQRHGVRSIIGNAGIYMVASLFLGDISGVLASISSAAPMLLSQQYSRSFETEADEKGAALMKSAQVDPKGLPSFFEKMIAEEKANLDKITNEKEKIAYKAALTFLSSHPSSEKRMQHLRDISHDDNIQYVNLAAEFSTLQNVVKEFVANTATQEESTTINEPSNTTSTKENTNEGNH